MNTPLLEIRNLSVHFRVYGGLLKVLDGVTLTVGVKEKVGLIGEAGCGKTTTMKAIMRILAENAQIPSGEILYNGKDILRIGKRDLQSLRRNCISMVFQDPTAALNPVFKVGTQLIDVIKYSHMSGGKQLSKDEARDRAVQVLKEVALPDPERIMENYSFQLSGGMRQRCCIAMALVAANNLLIADEPGTSLDVTIEDQILRLIGEIVRTKGISVILISHALGAVKGLVDKVYVMYAGTIVELAETEELFSNPLHPYTYGLIQAIPKITGGGVPQGIKGRIISYRDPPQGCRFAPRCDYAESSCREKKPESFKISEGHEVACFKYAKR